MIPAPRFLYVLVSCCLLSARFFRPVGRRITSAHNRRHIPQHIAVAHTRPVDQTDFVVSDTNFPCNPPYATVIWRFRVLIFNSIPPREERFRGFGYTFFNAIPLERRDFVVSAKYLSVQSPIERSDFAASGTHFSMQSPLERSDFAILGIHFSMQSP